MYTIIIGLLKRVGDILGALVCHWEWSKLTKFGMHVNTVAELPLTLPRYIYVAYATNVINNEIDNLRYKAARDESYTSTYMYVSMQCSWRTIDVLVLLIHLM